MPIGHLELLTKEGVETDVVEDLVPYEESKSPDTKTHIINPPENTHIWQPGMTSQDIVNIARLKGRTVKALCGYRFVPKHNPDNFEACQACIRIAGDLMRSEGE